jgi:hypothetical protein
MSPAERSRCGPSYGRIHRQLPAKSGRPVQPRDIENFVCFVKPRPDQKQKGLFAFGRSAPRSAPRLLSARREMASLPVPRQPKRLDSHYTAREGSMCSFNLNQ